MQLGPVEIDPLKSITSELPLSAITPPESVKYAFGGGNETVGCVFSHFLLSMDVNRRLICMVDIYLIIEVWHFITTYLQCQFQSNCLTTLGTLLWFPKH